MTTSLENVTGVLIAFIVAAAMTPALRYLSQRHYLLDQPNHRSSHTVPVPRIGGVAFMIGTVAGAAVLLDGVEWWLVGVGAGAVVAAAGGLLDDLRNLDAVYKFIPQVIAAAIVVVVLQPHVQLTLPFGSTTIAPELSGFLALFWIVSVMNAFNFLDGLDGLAAGVALVTAVVLAGLTSGAAQQLLIPFAAAICGFLLWNSAPAAIFMGDVGSQFVGFLLATSVLMPGPTDATALPVLLVFAPVLTDAAVTIVRRLLRGDSPFAADRAHVFHGLSRAGLSHRAVANLYVALTALCGLAGMWYLKAGSAIRLALLTGTIVIVTLLVVQQVSRSMRPAMERKYPVGESRGELTNG